MGRRPHRVRHYVFDPATRHAAVRCPHSDHPGRADRSAGWLSDEIGRRIVYLAGTAFGVLLAFPIFWLFETRNPTIVTAAIVIGFCLCQGVIFALYASFMPELFGTDARYSGVSLGRGDWRRSHPGDCRRHCCTDRRYLGGLANSRGARHRYDHCRAFDSRDGGARDAIIGWIAVMMTSVDPNEDARHCRPRPSLDDQATRRLFVGID